MLRNFGEQSPLFSKMFPKKNAKLISRTRDTPNLIGKCSSRSIVAVAPRPIGAAQSASARSLLVLATKGDPAGSFF